MSRTITRRAAIAGLSALGVSPVLAQSPRPEGTITIVHGFTPGGNSLCVAPEASLSNDSRAGWTAAPYYSFTLGGSVPCVIWWDPETGETSTT